MNQTPVSGPCDSLTRILPSRSCSIGPVAAPGWLVRFVHDCAPATPARANSTVSAIANLANAFIFSPPRNRATGQDLRPKSAQFPAQTAVLLNSLFASLAAEPLRSAR